MLCSYCGSREGEAGGDNAWRCAKCGRWSPLETEPEDEEKDEDGEEEEPSPGFLKRNWPRLLIAMLAVAIVAGGGVYKFCHRRFGGEPKRHLCREIAVAYCEGAVKARCVDPSDTAACLEQAIHICCGVDDSCDVRASKNPRYDVCLRALRAGQMDCNDPNGGAIQFTCKGVFGEHE